LQEPQITYGDRASVKLLTLLSADDIALAVLTAHLEKASLDLDLALLSANLVALGVLTADLEETSLDVTLGVAARRFGCRVLSATSGRRDGHGLGVCADLVALRILPTDDRRRKLQLGSASLVHRITVAHPTLRSSTRGAAMAPRARARVMKVAETRMLIDVG
jgi:hypothetical protein